MVTMQNEVRVLLLLLTYLAALSARPVAHSTALPLTEVEMEPAAPPRTRLGLGASCGSDQQCLSRACRCLQDAAGLCDGVDLGGKVCTKLLSVGSLCSEHSSCHSHKCYCAADPTRREDCPTARRCCFWSFGHWQCEAREQVDTALSWPARRRVVLGSS